MQPVDKTDLGEIVIVGTGLWLSIDAMSELAGTASVYEEILSGKVPLVFFLPSALSGLCGVFLLVFRRRLAIEFFGATEAGRSASNQEPLDLRPFLVSLLGLWFIASALISAASTEANSILFPAAELSESLFGGGRARALITTEAWLSRIPYVVELAVGLALFVSSGRIVEMWVRMRAAGRDR